MHCSVFVLQVYMLCRVTLWQLLRTTLWWGLTGTCSRRVTSAWLISTSSTSSKKSRLAWSTPFRSCSSYHRQQQVCVIDIVLYYSRQYRVHLLWGLSIQGHFLPVSLAFLDPIWNHVWRKNNMPQRRGSVGSKVPVLPIVVRQTAQLHSDGRKRSKPWPLWRWVASLTVSVKC